MRIFGAIAVLLILSAPTVLAIPQYTLMSGNRCANCHVNQQGAGLRNELGWYSMMDESIIKPSSIGLGGLFEPLQQSNLTLNETFNYGLDLRAQSSRGIDSGSTRKTFPMQVAMHAAWTPQEGITVEGTYNAGPIRYDGQTSWSASVLAQPTKDWPQVRIGHFQPSMGIRYDDHSMMIRQIADNTAYAHPLIAPNYAEYGAEITYATPTWLSLSAGVFDMTNLARVNINGRQITPGSVGYSGRLVVSDHNTFTAITNSYVGASVLAANSMTMTSVFAGVGLEDRVSLMGEVFMMHSQGLADTRNAIVALMVKVFDGVYLEGRAEQATLTSIAPTAYESTVTQWVIGAQLFVLPFLEIRPDYRIVETGQSPQLLDQYKAKRWNVQIHIFY
ncbi:MAG TPA: hypothetical protein VK147_00160 [Candidatus Didemnitutus sp.]|nr:hypothetical protein [Candidatus Didemnitutus sp.]